MLEILFLIKFCKHLASLAAAKGRSSGWGALGAVSWIGGEIGGAVVGLKAGSEGMGLYGYALLGAAVCALTAYLIVRNLSHIPPADFPTARVV